VGTTLRGRSSIQMDKDFSYHLTRSRLVFLQPPSRYPNKAVVGRQLSSQMGRQAKVAWQRMPVAPKASFIKPHSVATYRVDGH
jgi:hypothetical protein